MDNNSFAWHAYVVYCLLYWYCFKCYIVLIHVAEQLWKVIMELRRRRQVRADANKPPSVLRENKLKKVLSAFGSSKLTPSVKAPPQAPARGDDGTTPPLVPARSDGGT